MSNTAAAHEAHATCVYCGDEYSQERAEIGYPYCMKRECTEQGKKDKGATPIEFTFTEADTARF